MSNRRKIIILFQYNADAFEDRREGVEEILRPFLFVKGVSFFLCIS